ncbi:MAG: hypothetical protein Q7T62_18020 [Undibacterium sp.]|nr:hypothetical protein [Undibacterium sp.]
MALYAALFVPENALDHPAGAIFTVIVPVAVWSVMPVVANDAELDPTAVIFCSPFNAAGVAPVTSTTAPTSPVIPVLTLIVATLDATTRLSTLFNAKPFTRHASNTAISEPAKPLKTGAPTMPE